MQLTKMYTVELGKKLCAKSCVRNVCGEVLRLEVVSGMCGEVLASKGFVVTVFDFRGSGRSGGSATSRCARSKLKSER